MGIAGFFVWLQRHYGEAIDGLDTETGEVILNRGRDDRRDDHRDDRRGRRPEQRLPPYDNLYLDMNGLIHPCCHDTQPLPEPKSEEEMFQRIFAQLDQLVQKVRPRKCLVLAVDGVAPRSKMNQQRARRFRAATERQESNEIAEQMAEIVVQNHQLPRPAPRAKWDHNVITPSTPFMERVGQVLEWYVVSRLNSGDPLWKNLTVVLSDAHVPGEGEHKIMHYIRGLRAEPGYDPKTSHVVYGMDADLICLGLATHEVNFGVLRNVLNRETFQAEPNHFCVFNVRTFRRLLRRDFSNIRDMDFERVVDDFVFLCFFIGNDFLPHMPLVDIKCRGIETMLDHYVRRFDDFGYLTKEGNISFVRLRQFLAGFVADKMDSLLELKEHKQTARERAQRNVEGRIEQMRQSMRHALSQLKPDRSNSVEVSQEVFRCYSETAKEQTRFVGGKFPLSFEYGAPGYRDAFYSSKFGWTAPDPEKEADGDAEQQKLRDAFEQQIEMCCREYLRGMHWVMRYYTVSCPSWEWFYPYHYAPLIDDVARCCDKIDVEMRLGEPLHPVEQLLAVLPLESYHALPTELHASVLDPSSVFAKFYPKEMTVDFTESTFAYQGVIQLPFINCQKLRRACNSVCQLEPDEGTALIFCHDSSPLARKLSRLLQNRAAGTVLVPIPSEVTALVPIAGRTGLFPYAWPLHAGITCPDKGLAELPEGEPVKRNMCRTFAYEMNLHAAYIPRLLTEDVDARRTVGGRHEDHGDRHHRDDRRRDDRRTDDRRADRRDERRDERPRDNHRRREDRSDRPAPPREAGRKRERTPEPSSRSDDPSRPVPSATVAAVVAPRHSPKQSPKHASVGPSEADAPSS